MSTAKDETLQIVKKIGAALSTLEIVDSDLASALHSDTVVKTIEYVKLAREDIRLGRQHIEGIING